MVYYERMKDLRKPNFINDIKKIKKATLKTSSPYPEIRASYNWLNSDFPYMHTHSEWEILVVTEGKLKHTINSYQEICDAGYACLIRPSDCHCLDYADKEKPKFINFVFSNEIASKIMSLYEEFEVDLDSDAPLHFFLPAAIMEYIVDQSILMQSADKSAYEKFSILAVNQLIGAFFSNNIIKNNDYPDWLNAFLRHLHNPKTFSLSLTSIAKYSPYSYSYLTKVFKELTGSTLTEYVNNIKITYVKRLLRTTDKSILNISFDAGYDSVSSLNHNFKAETGLTPSQYRKQHKTARKTTTPNQ